MTSEDSPLLGYRFRDEKLRERALTHRSASACHNEQLEFLGDALLGMFIAEALFRRLHKADEGRLTHLRSTLVSNENLAALAIREQFGEHIKLGKGERKSGGWRRSSVLAGALEALIGAIYVDSGFAVCRDCVLKLYADRLRSIDTERVVKDAKTRLQEHTQAQGIGLPSYRVVDIRGVAHQRVFVVQGVVQTDPAIEISASANSKRGAEQLVAEGILQRLGVDITRD